MQSNWPNPLFANSGEVADVDAFSDPPTSANKVIAHKLVASQYVGFTAFLAARLLTLFPELLQDIIGPNLSSTLEGYVNLFGLVCIVGALALYVVALKVFVQVVFSPQMVAAQKMVYARAKTEWRFVAKMTVLCVTVIAGFVGILGADWVAHHYQLPHSAAVVFEATITSCFAGLTGWLAYRHMLTAFSLLLHGEVTTAKHTSQSVQHRS